MHRMGIPHLFRCISRTHPSAVRRASNATCDTLYVDFNAVIHVCARAVIDSRGHAADAVDEDEDDAGDIEEAIEDAIEDAIAAAAVRRMDELIERMSPRVAAFVAVDGTPPRAKMHQQRMRRYMTAWSAAASRGPGSAWDTNAITPGTVFMDAMAAALHRYAALPSSSGVRVIVSDAGEAGEGEQKIFQRIRETWAAGEELDVIVHGLDADLLLMGLLLPSGAGGGKLRVARDPMPDDVDGGFHMVDVSHLARLVARDVGPDDEDVSARLRDFVALCMLLGNDFVPGLPGLLIRDGGVGALLAAYRQAFFSQKHKGARSGWLAASGPDAMGGIDPPALAAVLRALAVAEDRAVAYADRRYYESCMRVASGKKHPNASAAATADVDPGRPTEDYPLRNPMPRLIRPGEGSGWRMRYYHYLFGSAEDVPGIALRYVGGLAWALAYMGQRCMSTGWHYPHAYAPTAMDVMHLLTADGDTTLPGDVAAHMDATEREFDAAFPPHLLQRRLLLVLPPSSAKTLIPAAIWEAAVRETPHAFPDGFRVATYLRDRLHECVPLLP